MKRLLYALVASSLLVGLTGPAKAQYDYTTIDVPDSTFTYAFGINDAGQIVGEYLGAEFYGFFLDVDGSYTTIDVPGAMFTIAYGINSSGQIVGSYDDDATAHGFLATPVP